MAFFKFRKTGDEPSSAPSQPESVEAMRNRAKYRLIGAAVLVLLGVVGFPLLFDKQQRPIAVDMPIEIPDKTKAKPLNIPAPAAADADKAPEAAAASAPVIATAPAVAPAVAPVLAVPPVVLAVPAPKLEPKEAVAPVQPAKAAPKLIAKPEPKPSAKAAPVPPVAKAVPKVDESAKAQALLDGKEVVKKPDAVEARFVVQVGAFADGVKAHEVRVKLESAGLKTYTNVAETKDGRRIRVRVGPLTSRAEAEKVAQKIKRLNLPANILTL